ncbi:hypothetical protein BU15DRAFT_79082 [Melanogaster broomeanus]|nr:hypothetical protein BU15DRAFT_79082 [Melanogaster broomeanus]
MLPPLVPVTGPSSTTTSVNPAILRGTGNNSAPGRRPRPKSMRANHSETRTQAAPYQEMVNIMVGTAQCYNCYITASPLWRKDDEGRPVCNARADPDSSKTPSASPGTSLRSSPTVKPSLLWCQILPPSQHLQSVPLPLPPNYRSQNFQTPVDAVPFLTVETLDTQVATNEQRTKRHRMSTDCV